MLDIQGFIDRIGLKNQDELAKKLGVKRSTVSSWSAGVRKPTFDMIEKLYKLGATTEELFGQAYLSSVRHCHDNLSVQLENMINTLLNKPSDRR